MTGDERQNSGKAGGGGVPVGRSRVITVARGPFSAEQPAEWTPGHYLRQIGHGTLSLFKGMGLTLGYFVRPSRVITQQYPENRETLKMFPRFRTRIELVREDDGAICCTACGICEKNCPNGSISVLTGRNEEDRKVLGRYLYRLGQCAFCGLCVESCPAGALRMTDDFEMAVYQRQDLELVLFDATAKVGDHAGPTAGSATAPSPEEKSAQPEQAP